MTSQEEIKEGVAQWLSGYFKFGWQQLDDKQHQQKLDEAQSLLSYLHSQGVVIKIDKKLLLISLKDAEEHDTKWAESNFTDSLQEFGKETQQNMLKAGYVAIEPLIKEAE